MVDFLFPELYEVVEGQTVKEHWLYYTTNVIYLGTVSHEQFVAEFPEAAKRIKSINEKQEKFKTLLGEVK